MALIRNTNLQMADTGSNNAKKALTGTSMGGNVSHPDTVQTTSAANRTAESNAARYGNSKGSLGSQLSNAVNQMSDAINAYKDSLINTSTSTTTGGSTGGSTTSGSSRKASSGGGSSSGGSGSSVADLIGDVVIDPTAEIRQRYAGILSDLANNNQFVLDKLKGNYDTSVNTINADFDVSQARQNQDAEDALRQAYINYMMSRKNMDSDMMRQGYNGGVSESNQARMYNNYGNIRNDIRNSLANAIEQLNLKRNAQLGEALNQYNAQLADQTTDYYKQKQNYETALSNAIANLLK